MTRARSGRRASRRPPPRRRGPSLLGLRGRGLWIAAAAGVLAILAIALAAAAGGGDGSGGGGEFPIVVYQGTDELGAAELDFNVLLGRGKPVVMNFWAGACPPCRAEMPAFQRVYEAHRGEILLIGVDIGPFVGLGSHEDARNLLAELGITYPAAYAVTRQPVLDYGVRSMPTTVFFDGSGQVVGVRSGLLREADLESAVGALLARAE